MQIVPRLDKWFNDALQDMNRDPATVAYVVSVLKTMSNPSDDEVLAGRSVVLAFDHARSCSSFVEMQRVGDWVLWTSIVVPAHIQANRGLVEEIGKVSYAACDRFLRGSWRVYHELAKELPVIAAEAHSRLFTVQIAR